MSRYFLEDVFYKYQKRQQPFVLLDTAWKDELSAYSFLFTCPHDIIVLSKQEQLNSFFRRLEEYYQRGYWLAGFFHYEFGYLLEEPLRNCLSSRFSSPLAWLGVFKNPLKINLSKVPLRTTLWNTSFLKSENNDRETLTTKDFAIKNLKPGISLLEYKESIEKIKTLIAEGETYQVNYTFPIYFQFKGDICYLYKNIRYIQPTPYMAFIYTNKDYILSFSPELFFSIKKRHIITRPMKGTFKRGRYFEEDRYYRQCLKRSIKNRAENLMIVDLLRNDLGRLAYPGSVQVLKIFNIEEYPTVFQMTSTIKAKLKKSLKWKDIWRALFPSGSVTGAPKIRTMQIIHNLEKSERGIYTGSIGYISPKGEACFNVAIRTLMVDKKGKGRLGVGGGIVYDSCASQEYREALLKAKFFTKAYPKISLIETMRASKEKGYYLIYLHLRRLKRSCQFFAIPFPYREIKQTLKELREKFEPKHIYKVRIILKREGSYKVLHFPLKKIRTPLRVKISNIRINADNIYLYHKTNQRLVYQRELNKAHQEGYDEVIFTNKQGELTEGSFSTIFIRRGNRLFTPTISCGLLSGVFREYLLKKGIVKEGTLYLKDLLTADKFLLGNSVRGLLPARIGKE